MSDQLPGAEQQQQFGADDESLKLDLAAKFRGIPASVPPYNSPQARRTADQDEGAVEEKKNKKTLIADREQIENIKRQRKLKIADLISPRSDMHGSTWPYDLILVRHGQSEGNEAVSRSERGDLSAYTPEFKKKHSSTYRLTDKGVQQAKVAGAWIKENIGEKFDRCYTSEYVRAMETAAYLDLPDAKWYTEIVLRERDKGILDNTSAVDKAERFAGEMERRKRDAFFWAPPGGESIANVCIRIDHTLNTLRRECTNQRVLIVCHGEVMWAFRVRVERLSQIQFHKLQKSKDPKDRIHNSQVIHYTRIHPQTGEVFPEFRFMRASCPWKPQYSSDEWVEFSRPSFSSEELLESVHLVPRYVNNTQPANEGDENVNY